MTAATALTICRIGVGVTCAMLAAEFAGFYLHLFVLPALGVPFLVVATLLPSLITISIYQKALKAEETKPD